MSSGFIIILTLLLCVQCQSLSMRRDSSSVSRLFQNRLVNERLLLDASYTLQVPSPWNAPRWLWSFAWKLHSFMLPILHCFDTCKSSDSCLNLAVLWWKAISGNRKGCTFDNHVAFDLLPSITRRVVMSPLCYFYPNLHHQNVALRTAYLDSALEKEIEQCFSEYGSSNPQQTRVKVIILGAGYDTRSLRFLNHRRYHTTQQKHNTLQFFEIDLESVSTQKQKMFQRFCKRRSRKDSQLPRLLGADLNDLDAVKAQLSLAFEDAKSDGNCKIIYLVEAVLMYLDQSKVSPLLSMCVNEAKGISNRPISFVFADRLPNVTIDESNPEVEKESAIKTLQSCGLRVQQWLLKPGRARHMGVCTSL